MGKLTAKVKQAANKTKSTAGKAEAKTRKGTRRTARKVDRAV